MMMMKKEGKKREQDTKIGCDREQWERVCIVCLYVCAHTKTLEIIETIFYLSLILNGFLYLLLFLWLLLLLLPVVWTNPGEQISSTWNYTRLSLTQTERYTHIQREIHRYTDTKANWVKSKRKIYLTTDQHTYTHSFALTLIRTNARERKKNEICVYVFMGFASMHCCRIVFHYYIQQQQQQNLLWIHSFWIHSIISIACIHFAGCRPS